MLQTGLLIHVYVYVSLLLLSWSFGAQQSPRLLALDHLMAGFDVKHRPRHIELSDLPEDQPRRIAWRGRRR